MCQFTSNGRTKQVFFYDDIKSKYLSAKSSNKHCDYCTQAAKKNKGITKLNNIKVERIEFSVSSFGESI